VKGYSSMETIFQDHINILEKIPHLLIWGVLTLELGLMLIKCFKKENRSVMKMKPVYSYEKMEYSGVNI